MRIRWLALTAAAWAAPALAAEGGGEGNIFAGDLGNALWTLVIFGLVLFVLGRYAWGPLLNTLQQREQFIRDSLETARREREEAETRLREYTEKLEEARAEATAIVEEGRRDADEVRRRIEEKGREESKKMVQRARKEIEIAKQTAIKDLYATGADLATGLAGRILRREIKSEDHERLISETLEKLEGGEAN